MLNTSLPFAAPLPEMGFLHHWRPLFYLMTAMLVISAQIGKGENFAYKNISSGDFPGGPVGKTPCSQCRGPGFDPWSGN